MSIFSTGSVAASRLAHPALSLGFFKSLLFKVARGIFPKHKSSCALLLKTLWWPPSAGRIKTKLSRSQIELGRGVNSILGHEDKKNRETFARSMAGKGERELQMGRLSRKLSCSFRRDRLSMLKAKRKWGGVSDLFK